MSKEICIERGDVKKLELKRSDVFEIVYKQNRIFCTDREKAVIL